MIRPADSLGAVLTGRSVAESLRHSIESELLADATSDVVVDFGGVVVMSPSFADELFAKLPIELRRRVRCRNLDEDLDSLVHFVIEGRKTSHA